MRIGIVEKNTITRIIEAKSIDAAKDIFPNTEVVDASGLSIGWVRGSAGKFSAVQVPETKVPELSPVEFMDLFTPEEEGAIRLLARSTDPAQAQASVQMEAFLARIMAADGISLDDPRVIHGAHALRQLGILKTDDRRDAVLSGTRPE